MQTIDNNVLSDLLIEHFDKAVKSIHMGEEPIQWIIALPKDNRHAYKFVTRVLSFESGLRSPNQQIKIRCYSVFRNGVVEYWDYIYFGNISDAKEYTHTFFDYFRTGGNLIWVRAD